MSTISIKKFIPGIAWFFVVLVLIAMPGKDVPDTGWMHITDLDKIVHMGVFGLLAVLFCWPFYKSGVPKAKKIKTFLVIAALTIVWGYCTELIQYFFIPDRTYDLQDWAADSIGAVFAFLFSRMIFIK